MKYIVVLLITTFLFATPATKEDIKEIKQDIKLLIQKVDNLDKKVYANTLKIDMFEKNMNQRFEAIDKRFEMMNESFNKRSEAINKRFEMMNESFNKRFEAIDKRFETIDKRFEILTNFMMALTGGIFGLIGFMMWDRRTVVDRARRDIENSEIINKKADKEYVDRLIKAVNELLAKDEMAREVFKKYGLI
ncbi:hypothetical protein [Caminibacter sp.]